MKNLKEPFFKKIRIKINKWLLCCSYNPNKLQILSQLQELSNRSDSYYNKYEKSFFHGWFLWRGKGNKFALVAQSMQINIRNFKSPSCVDLLLTNSGKSLESYCTAKTGPSDFHELVVIMIEEKHEYLPLTVIGFRDYKKLWLHYI